MTNNFDSNFQSFQNQPELFQNQPQAFQGQPQNFQNQPDTFLSQQEAMQNQQRWGWQCPPCPPCRCDCRQCWGWGGNWNRPWDGRGQMPGQGNQPPRR